MLSVRRSYLRAPGLKMPIDVECKKVISTTQGIRIFSWVINQGTTMPSLRPCRREDRSHCRPARYRVPFVATLMPSPDHVIEMAVSGKCKLA